MVAHLYGLRQRRDKSAISDEGRTTSYRRETMPARVRQMISPFRLPGVLL